MRWKSKQIDNLQQIRYDLQANNVSQTIIDNYSEVEESRILKQYNVKLQTKPSQPNINKLKQQEIDNIILTKQHLESRGCKPELIKKYIEREYENITKKYQESI